MFSNSTPLLVEYEYLLVIKSMKLLGNGMILLIVTCYLVYCLNFLSLAVFSINILIKYFRIGLNILPSFSVLQNALPANPWEFLSSL